MILTAVLSGAGAIALLLIWRYASVARGARRRDEALSRRLAPLAARLEAKQPVAEAVLAYWLQHPNELRSAPEALEYLETIQHPYGSAVTPYESVAGAFSRASDVFGRANAQELSSGMPACTSGGKVLPGAPTKPA